MCSLQWRHNGRDGVSDHQHHECLFNCLFRRRSKKTSKLRVTGLCEGNSQVTGEFPAQRDSDNDNGNGNHNAENNSIWWRHHVIPEDIQEICTELCFMCHFFSDVLLFANNVSLGPVKRCLAEPQVWASCMNAYTYFAKQPISFVFDWFLQNIIFNHKFTGPIKIMVLYIQLGQCDDTVSVSWWHCDMETLSALLALCTKGQ